MRRLCGTLSKALAKSKYIMSVPSPVSRWELTLINEAKSCVIVDFDGIKPCCVFVFLRIRLGSILL